MPHGVNRERHVEASLRIAGQGRRSTDPCRSSLAPRCGKLVHLVVAAPLPGLAQALAESGQATKKTELELGFCFRWKIRRNSGLPAWTKGSS